MPACDGDRKRVSQFVDQLCLELLILLDLETKILCTHQMFCIFLVPIFKLILVFTSLLI